MTIGNEIGDTKPTSWDSALRIVMSWTVALGTCRTSGM
jgi:hypothetical protein